MRIRLKALERAFESAINRFERSAPEGDRKRLVSSRDYDGTHHSFSTIMQISQERRVRLRRANARSIALT